MIHTIMRRSKVMVNTDPQRRCYDGCYFSVEYGWGPWESLDRADDQSVDRKLTFWRELNDYAVSQRGDGARAEFKAVPTTI